MPSQDERAPFAERTRQAELAAPTVHDVFAFLARRKWIFLAAFVPVLLVAAALAFGLPPVYLSQATILVEQSTIPEETVQPAAGYVDEQIQVVTQRVLSATGVADWVARFGLYPDESRSRVIEQFRADTVVEPITAEVVDRRTNRLSQATIGFTLGYRAASPELAQAVTSELADAFLTENARARMQRATDTSRFLEREAERLARDMAETEERIAAFKSEHGDALPDQYALNVQALERTERELEEAQRLSRDLRAQRDLLRNQLAVTDRYAPIYSETGAPILGAAVRLDELRQQYASFIARYGPEHPDVIRARREIDALTAGETAGTRAAIDTQIATLEAELDAYRDRGYSAVHPDVQRAESSLAALREERGRTPADAPARTPDNPEYIRLQLESQAADTSLAAAEQRRAALETRLADLENRLAAAARVEQEWLLLNRGYESTRAEFLEIKRRSTEARLSERLEESNQGDRFTLIESATLPERPVEPNRLAIMFLGMVLALGSGIGLAALTDAVDKTVRGSRDLLATTGLKPLVVVPLIEVEGARARLATRAALAVGAVCGMVALFVLFGR